MVLCGNEYDELIEGIYRPYEREVVSKSIKSRSNVRKCESVYVVKAHEMGSYAEGSTRTYELFILIE